MSLRLMKLRLKKYPFKKICWNPEMFPKTHPINIVIFASIKLTTPTIKMSLPCNDLCRIIAALCRADGPDFAPSTNARCPLPSNAAEKWAFCHLWENNLSIQKSLRLTSEWFCNLKCKNQGKLMNFFLDCPIKPALGYDRGSDNDSRALYSVLPFSWFVFSVFLRFFVSIPLSPRPL